MEIDLKRIVRERVRGFLLWTLHRARSFGANEDTLQEVIHRSGYDMTDLEIRRELEYLELRQLIEIGRPSDSPFWWAKLTRAGVDVQEGTVPCDPGIKLMKE
ncbi:MAG: hypothetical protein A4E68_01924 [Syntrophaceae bacterium PtaB.Bin095]|jgi:hypothetical protein|nr:MAG: hypothetical protein A4E68_01924 [Syntrophaceae bacterium PtaB.Bin095]